MNEDEEVLIIIILVCYFGFCDVNIKKKGSKRSEAMGVHIAN